MIHPCKPATAKALAALAALTACPAMAQNVAPFEINPERVHYQSVQRCTGARTLIVPTFYLHVSIRNRLTTQGPGKRGKPRIYVEGLDKGQLQALARTLYDDLIARLRANGATVLTYDDIRADLATFPRKDANPRYGLPAGGERGSALDFATATPSDEQVISWDGKGPAWPYHRLAHDRFAAVIVPEVTLTLPRTGRGTRDGPSTALLSKDAPIPVEPVLLLSSATMNGMPDDMKWCTIRVQEHTFRLAAEMAGRIEPITRDEAGDRDWAVRRGDYAFAVDRPAFDAGVTRVGLAFNALMAEALKGE